MRFSNKLLAHILISLFTLLPITTLNASEDPLKASVEREIKIGKKVTEEIENQMEVITDPIITSRVTMVFEKLLPGVTRPLPYQIKILKIKSPNAFCVPGGNIYVTTGMLDMVKSDAELAAVLAHELMHADKKHGIIQMERNQKISLGALAMIIATKGQAGGIAISGVASMAVSGAYSRDLEEEADLGAIELLQKASYTPVASVTILEAMANEELRMPFYDAGIGASHPKTQARLKYVLRALKEKNVPIQRKNALNLLRTTIHEEEDGVILKVDGQNFMAVDDPSQENKNFLKEIKNRLDSNFQMELSPAEIRAVTLSNGTKVLVTGSKEITREPLPKGSPTIEDMRETLLKALHHSRNDRPSANYLM